MNLGRGLVADPNRLLIKIRHFFFTAVLPLNMKRNINLRESYYILCFSLSHLNYKKSVECMRGCLFIPWEWFSLYFSYSYSVSMYLNQTLTESTVFLFQCIVKVFNPRFFPWNVRSGRLIDLIVTRPLIRVKSWSQHLKRE